VLGTLLLGQILHMVGVEYTAVVANTSPRWCCCGGYFTLVGLDTLLLGKIRHLDGVGYTAVGEDTAP
jgi:hypothetical protein